MIAGIIKYLQPAFEGDNAKASAPKITSFWFVVLVTIVHIWWLHKAMTTGNFDQMGELMYTDCATIITLQGLKVWERVKNNNSLGGTNGGQN